jgi:hypothetical protein
VSLKPILDPAHGAVYIMELDLWLNHTTRASELPEHVELVHTDDKNFDHAFIAGMALDNLGNLFAAQAWLYRELIYRVQISRVGDLENMVIVTEEDLIESQRWYDAWLYQQLGRLGPYEYPWGTIESSYELRGPTSSINVSYPANSPFQQYANGRHQERRTGLRGLRRPRR